MSFKGTGMVDLEKLLQAFPREFTIDQVVGRFGWSVTRTRQAIVNGQQTDTVRVIQEVRSPKGGTNHAIYENTQWRKEWLKRAWRSHEPIMDGERQEHG